MADDPSRDKPVGADHAETDSVMALDFTGIEQATSRPASPSQSMASTGLFFKQPEGPATHVSEAQMSPDAINQAMLDLQRSMAAQYRRESLDQEAGGRDGSEMIQDSMGDSQAKTFARLKAKYLEKQAEGSLSLEEEVGFMRAESAEKARLRKLQQDADYDNPIVEPEEDGHSLLLGRDEVPNLSDTDSDEGGKGKKRARKGGKRGGGGATDRPSKKTKRSAAPKARKVAGQNYTDADMSEVLAGQSSRKATTVPKAPKHPSKKAPKAKAGPSMTNIGNLWGTDIFRDAAANEDLPDEPTHDGAVRRADAMKQLIASVPMESRDMARYDQKYLDKVIKEDFTGQGSVKPAEGGNWLVRGMKTPLRSYQILGSAFLRRRETGHDLPRGGIMADGMGLGKTLMTLANIINGKPKRDKRLRTTLIVASPALINQWQQEIQTHCQRESESPHGVGMVIQHRAGNRITDPEVLQRAEIVLTTWSEVNRSYPKADVPKELVTAKQKDEWWRDHYEKNRGILHSMRFLRVVLDEAQNLRNHKTKGSMACRALEARHYWALTGTPIYNSISEFYSLFKFLREPAAGDFRLFRFNFCDPNDPTGLEKLNAFLRKLMVRRTHQDTLFGAKLLNLPKPHETTVRLEFNSIERSVYEVTKQRMISKINSISRQEGVPGLQKKFQHVWAMILRLRQLCSHVLLIEGIILDVLEREDVERLNHLASSEEGVSDEGATLLVHLKQALSARSAQNTVEGTTGATLSETQVIATGTVDIGDVDDDIGGVHGLSFDFKKYLKALVKSDKWTEVTDRSCCVGCRQKAVNPYISDCFHIYCYGCLTDVMHHAARRGQDFMKCAECGHGATNFQPCSGLEDLAEELTESSPADTQVTAGKGGKKKRDAKDLDLIGIGGGDILPSAKTRAAKAQVLDWIEEDEDAKIIIYTQFIPMIRILERICNTERWDYCKYTGQMSQDARSAAINEFGDKKKGKKILLASLKAGGLGLNLTMASRVLLLDPWWNSAVEQQAFARVFRIGQVKETHLVRLVITNTIDSAMMAIKRRKDEDIDAVMNDSKRKETLSVQDLMRLFGEVREDGEGKPFIFAQEPDADEGKEHLRYARADSDDEEVFMGNEN